MLGIKLVYLDITLALRYITPMPPPTPLPALTALIGLFRQGFWRRLAGRLFRRGTTQPAEDPIEEFLLPILQAIAKIAAAVQDGTYREPEYAPLGARRARPKAARRGPKDLRPEAAADPRTGAPVAPRAARGQAPSAQAPARPTGGGETIPRTQAIQAARAAAPLVAACPPRRPATAPAAPGPHPIKKSPPGACEDARPYCSEFVTT